MPSIAARRTRARERAAVEPAARIYKWVGGGFKTDPAVVGAELERLEIRPGDYHRTADVLKAARDKNSPLHECLEWDNDVAGEAHRMNQCRAMLRSIAIVTLKQGKRVKTPIYVHSRSKEDGPCYVRADRVATDQEVRQAALDEALAMITGLTRRYEWIEELQPMFEVVRKMSRNLKAKKR